MNSSRILGLNRSAVLALPLGGCADGMEGLAAGLVWLLSNHVSKQPTRIVIDRKTGDEIAIEGKHDLLFIPLRYWPVILLVGGLVAMFL